MKKSILCKCLLLLTSATLATPFSGCRGDQNNNSQPAATSRYTDVLSMKLSGFVGDRISGNNTNYLNRMVYANSSMFETFFQRNAAQEWSTSAWNGEFPGKILQSIARCYRMSGEAQQEELKKTGNYIVSNLKKAQASDGYLGIASDEKKYVGRMSSNGDGYWDLWAQYHCIYGLLLWYEETGNADALEIAVKAGDAMYGFFIEQGHSLSELDAKIPDFSAIRAFTSLYMVEKDEKYMEMIELFLRGWKVWGGNFIENALAGKEFYKGSVTRWEALPGICAIADLYEITGETQYLEAFTQIYKSILATDVHNTGGFSTGEEAIGNPYPVEGTTWTASIETCCSIAWMELSVRYYQLTHNSNAADELEIAFYNAILGSQAANGSWWTYSSLMNGVKRAAIQDIGGQGYSTSPELSCCAANAANGIGLLSWYAADIEEKNAFLNYYGPGSITFAIEDKNVTLIQETNYPLENYDKITVSMKGNKEFALNLRIPYWSENTVVKVNGQAVDGVVAGQYFSIQKNWKNGDIVEIMFDLQIRALRSDERNDNRVSLYYGPMLLAIDKRYNPNASDSLRVSMEQSPFELVSTEDVTYPNPYLKIKATLRDGTDIYLTDYTTCGMTGTEYYTWFYLAD